MKDDHLKLGAQGKGKHQGKDGWMDGWNCRYRVSTALRIVYWPSLSILGGDASRLVWLFQLTIPPKVTIAEKA